VRGRAWRRSGEVVKLLRGGCVWFILYDKTGVVLFLILKGYADFYLPQLSRQGHQAPGEIIPRQRR